MFEKVFTITKGDINMECKVNNKLMGTLLTDILDYVRDYGTINKYGYGWKGNIDDCVITYSVRAVDY